MKGGLGKLPTSEANFSNMPYAKFINVVVYVTENGQHIVFLVRFNPWWILIPSVFMIQKKPQFEVWFSYGVLPEMPLYERRQIRLLNQVALLAVVLSLVDILINVGQNRCPLIVGDFLILPSSFLVLLMNKRGGFQSSRFVLAVSIQVALALSLFIAYEVVTLGVYVQHLMLLFLISSFPVVFVDPVIERTEFFASFFSHIFLIAAILCLPYFSDAFASLRAEAVDFDLVVMASVFMWLGLQLASWYFRKGFFMYQASLNEWRSAGESAQLQIDELSMRCAELEKKHRQLQNRMAGKVALHTRNLEEENQRLREYAMVNTRIIKTPLEQIKGLVESLSSEVEQDDGGTLEELKVTTVELEQTLSRIQRLLGEEAI